MTRESYFQDQMASDFGKCRMVMPQTAISFVMAQVGRTVPEGLRHGPPPQFIMDLEQLQVVDYTSLDGISEHQRNRLRALHSEAPIQVEEMIYLALRSLFDMIWPRPMTRDELVRAVQWSSALNVVLKRCAFEIRNHFTDDNAALPYWGRFAYLSVMSGLPSSFKSEVAQLAPDRVTCALIKRPKFNATTFPVTGGALIGLNWALEPILKNLNRILLHYFHTEQFAGSGRIDRAWRTIAPTVLYFWSDIPASDLPGDTCLFFDERAAWLAKTLTDDQVKFVLAHELGHVTLDHPQRFSAARATGNDVTDLRHEFEFAADGFAFASQHSGARVSGSADAQDAQAYFDSQTTPEGKFEPESRLDATHLLFQYMVFVEQTGALIRDRAGERLRMRTSMDTHPTPSDRVARLEADFQHGIRHTTPLTRYAEALFGKIHEYVRRLDDEALLAAFTSRSLL